MDIEVVDGIIQMATQGDLRPMIGLFPKNSPYTSIFMILIGVFMKEEMTVFWNFSQFLQHHIKFDSSINIP
jgi:hypothetical protein